MSDPVVLDEEMQVDEAIIDENAPDDDVTAEEEIDELADDDELDDVGPSTTEGVESAAKGEAAPSSTPAGGASSSKKSSAAKKPPRKPANERTPGSSLLPASRVTKIMKADKDLGITAKEAVFLVSIATEEFIKRLALDGHRQATHEGRSVITQKDLGAAVRRSDELLFLKEIITLPVPLAQAVAKRQAKADGVEIEGESRSAAPAARPGGAAISAGTPAPTAGTLDAFIDRKPGARKTRPSRGGVGGAIPDGLVNGQHTFAVDPSVLERERHPSYFGDFSLPITPTPIPTTAPAITSTSHAAPRTSGRLSIPSARRAAQNEDAMDTT